MGSNDCGGASFNVPRQYGVTKPLSTAGPTEADLQRNMELEKVLLSFIVHFGIYFFNYYFYMDFEFSDMGFPSLLAFG